MQDGEKYTIWEATEKPIEVNVDKLRKCKPPYEGSTTEELWKYLEENVYNWENKMSSLKTIKKFMVKMNYKIFY